MSSRGSTTAASRTPASPAASSAACRAWKEPIRPRPTTASRKGGVMRFLSPGAVFSRLRCGSLSGPWRQKVI